MIDAKIYFDRFATLISQYELTVKAIDSFQGGEKDLQAFLEEELDDLRDLITSAFDWQGDFYDHWVFSDQGAESYLADAKMGVRDRLREVHLRIRQNHVVLLVTFLDACLRDVHRAILTENPALLRSDRQIPLASLISSSTEEILEQEIEREVLQLEHLPVSARARYFSETLNLSWYGDPVAYMLEEANRLRNRILHEDPDAEVTGFDVINAQMVCMAVPLACITQASVLYPDIFRPLGESNEKIRKTMTTAGRLLRKVPVRTRNRGGHSHRPE